MAGIFDFFSTIVGQIRVTCVTIQMAPRSIGDISMRTVKKGLPKRNKICTSRVLVEI